MAAPTVSEAAVPVNPVPAPEKLEPVTVPVTLTLVPVMTPPATLAILLILYPAPAILEVSVPLNDPVAPVRPVAP